MSSVATTTAQIAGAAQASGLSGDVAWNALFGFAGVVVGSLLSYWLGWRAYRKQMRLELRRQPYMDLITGLRRLEDSIRMEHDLEVFPETLPADAVSDYEERRRELFEKIAELRTLSKLMLSDEVNEIIAKMRSDAANAPETTYWMEVLDHEFEVVRDARIATEVAAERELRL